MNPGEMGRSTDPGGSILSRAFAIRSADFYAMSDFELTKRLGGALWLSGATIAAVLLPLAPPDNSSLGDSGWLLAIGVVLFAYGVAARFMLQPDRVSANEILALNYVALGLIACLMWLYGESAPYTELLLLPLLYTAAAHPLRRLLPFIAATGLALASPLLYPGNQTLAPELARFLLWGGMAIAASVYASKIRLERRDLQARGDEARSEARLDPLTGLGNRRAFDEALAAAEHRSGRTHTKLSVIIADLDSFKAINDTYGLPVGDECLRDVARVIDAAVRRPDSCFRWGGDEFVVVADVNRAGAERLAERISRRVAELCRRPDGEPVLLHVGTAELGVQGSDPASLLATASAALKPAGEGTPR